MRGARPNDSLWIIIFTSFLMFTNAMGQSNNTLMNPSGCLSPEVDACAFFSCENSGVCVQDTTIPECARCVCPPGFTGRTCESTVVITPGTCNPTCINGGFCVGSTCVCPAGFNGAFCQQRDYCAPTNPCQNGGRCTSGSTNFICDCSNTGFTGTTCTDRLVTDLCASQPCANGGQCSVVNNAVSCRCINGYTGVFCQIAPLPCASTPCQNGGQCGLLSPNVFGCVCPPEFTGTQCETSILANHPCVTQPTAVCMNGGTCTVNGAGYICRCATGWSGVNCQTRDTSSTCNPNPCGAHGTCFEAILPTGPLAVCSCSAGWTGRLCDVNVDTSCPSNYCLSGGSCVMAGGNPFCLCPPQYTGVRCESPSATVTTSTTTTTTTPDVCSSNPCLNGGSCIPSFPTFVCICPPSWTGSVCSTYAPSTVTTTTITTTTSLPGQICSPTTCMNGGTCYTFGDDPVCMCQYPWSGQFCNENLETGVVLTTTTTVVPTTVSTTTTTTPAVNVCVEDTCLNGGSCYMINGQPLCICQYPWSGPRCDQNQLITTTSTVQTTMTTTTPANQLTCANNPCRNGGTCVPMGSSFFCFCGLTSNYTGQRCDTTTPMTGNECPLACAPGRCVFSGNAEKPYACLWNGIMRPKDGTTG